MSRSSGPRARIVRRRRGGITVTATELRALVERALRVSGAPKSGEAVVTLVDDSEITALNETQMKKRGATDVLSFPLLEPTAYPARPGTARRAAHSATSSSASIAPLPRRAKDTAVPMAQRATRQPMSCDSSPFMVRCTCADGITDHPQVAQRCGRSRSGFCALTSARWG